MSDVVRDWGMPALMKLDIEGAEVAVLCDMIAKAITPPQILVEYDELMAPSQRSKERIEQAHSALTSVGYKLIRIEGCNCLYTHPALRKVMHRQGYPSVGTA